MDTVQSETTGERTNQTVAAGISKPYAYHKPSEDGLTRITKLRRMFSELDQTIYATCLPSRERSTAITQLETAAMWAIKAIVLNDPESVPETLPAA